MKKVLVISPHFPPVNAPDMQRARLALPHLRQLGWEPVVLAVHPDSVEGAVIDPVFEQTYPADIRVIRVKGIPPRLTRRAGLGSLWWRCARALRKAGDTLLKSESFDLVFFTTTQFDTFTLGPRWLRRHGVPFVVDYQDPWVNDYYRQTCTPPPGGRFKFWCSQFTARLREPAVLRAAAGIIAVSPGYGPALHARYPWFPESRVTTIPFGTSSADLDIARLHTPSAIRVPVGDGCFHHVYAGRCGRDMHLPLKALLRAFKQFLVSHPDEARRHRFHFIGTGYAPPPLGLPCVLPLAEAENLAGYVFEHCYRVPYFEALYNLVHADALMVIGSDDPTYSASKIFPYLLARRPLLTLAHNLSTMLPLTRAQPGATACGFDEATTLDAFAAEIHEQWFVQAGFRRAPAGDNPHLETYGGARMTSQLVAGFDRALSAHRPITR